MLTNHQESLGPFARSRAEVNQASNFSKEEAMRSQVVAGKFYSADVMIAIEDTFAVVPSRTLVEQAELAPS